MHSPAALQRAFVKVLCGQNGHLLRRLEAGTVLDAGADGPAGVTAAQLDDVQADIDAGNAALLQESTFLIDLLAADATGPLSPPVRFFWDLALLIIFNSKSVYNVRRACSGQSAVSMRTRCESGGGLAVCVRRWCALRRSRCCWRSWRMTVGR